MLSSVLFCMVKHANLYGKNRVVDDARFINSDLEHANFGWKIILSNLLMFFFSDLKKSNMANLLVRCF